MTKSNVRRSRVTARINNGVPGLPFTSRAQYSFHITVDPRGGERIQASIVAAICDLLRGTTPRRRGSAAMCVSCETKTDLVGDIYGIPAFWKILLERLFFYVTRISRAAM